MKNEEQLIVGFIDWYLRGNWFYMDPEGEGKNGYENRFIYSEGSPEDSLQDPSIISAVELFQKYKQFKER